MTTLEGTQPLDDFCAEMKRKRKHVRDRWVPRGLPILRVGPDIYVKVGPPYTFTARDWLNNGMMPPEPKPRRKL